MLERIEKYLTQKRRAYLYRVAVAVIVLLGGYGIVSGEEIATLTALIGALLGQSTATAFTSTKE